MGDGGLSLRPRAAAHKLAPPFIADLRPWPYLRRPDVRPVLRTFCLFGLFVFLNIYYLFNFYFLYLFFPLLAVREMVSGGKSDFLFLFYVMFFLIIFAIFESSASGVFSRLPGR